MTVKEASILFGKDESRIRESIKEGMVPGIRKAKGRYVIPDDTKIIPSKMDIRFFLLEVIKFKNNPNVVISRSSFPDVDSLSALLELVYRLGFIGEYSLNDMDVQTAFKVIQLTDKGLELLVGRSSMNALSKYQINLLPINMSITNQIGLINGKF